MANFHLNQISLTEILPETDNAMTAPLIEKSNYYEICNLKSIHYMILFPSTKHCLCLIPMLEA